MPQQSIDLSMTPNVFNHIALSTMLTACLINAATTLENRSDEGTIKQVQKSDAFVEWSHES